MATPARRLRRTLVWYSFGSACVVATLVGDTVDDMQAARACGTAGLLYHPLDRALLSRNRAEKLGAPVVGNLYEAVAWVIAANDGPESGC